MRGLLLLLLAAPVAAGKLPSPKAVDVYGTDAFTYADVKAEYGGKITEFCRARWKGLRLKSNRNKKAVEDGIRGEYGLASVKLSLIDYDLHDPGRKSYVTIDAVEKGDVKRRMPFRRKPQGFHTDPDGLLKAWEEYEKKAWSLIHRGKIDTAKADCGKAFHCFAGYGRPELREYGELFAKKVPEHGSELARILKDDMSARKRASAAFLLAHIESGKKLVKALLPAVYDPEPTVRNNAMRVLSYVADKHPEIDIDPDPFFQAIDFPETTDRNKALAVFFFLSKDPETHKEIAKKAGETLIRLAALKQPNNRQFAHGILKNISGKDFAADDSESWKAWLDSGEWK